MCVCVCLSVCLLPCCSCYVYLVYLCIENQVLLRVSKHFQHTCTCMNLRILLNALCSNIMATFADHLYLLCFLFCRSGEEIAVVYYRAGYSPNDYPTEKVQCTYTVHIHMQCTKGLFGGGGRGTCRGGFAPSPSLSNWLSNTLYFVLAKSYPCLHKIFNIPSQPKTLS